MWSTRLATFSPGVMALAPANLPARERSWPSEPYLHEGIDLAGGPRREGGRHDLDVLLRHRLLRKPGGFEGFGRISVDPKSSGLAVAESPNVRPRLIYLNTAGGSPTKRIHQDDNLITGL